MRAWERAVSFRNSLPATARQFRFLLGRCVEFGDEIRPLAPLHEMVAGLVDDLDEDAFGLVMGVARQPLGRVFTGYDDGVMNPMSLSAVCELAVGVLRRLAQRGPMVLVVEDLHWSDASTRVVLDVDRRQQTWARTDRGNVSWR